MASQGSANGSRGGTSPAITQQQRQDQEAAPLVPPLTRLPSHGSAHPTSASLNQPSWLPAEQTTPRHRRDAASIPTSQPTHRTCHHTSAQDRPSRPSCLHRYSRTSRTSSTNDEPAMNGVQTRDRSTHRPTAAVPVWPGSILDFTARAVSLCQPTHTLLTSCTGPQHGFASHGAAHTLPNQHAASGFSSASASHNPRAPAPPVSSSANTPMRQPLTAPKTPPSLSSPASSHTTEAVAGAAAQPVPAALPVPAAPPVQRRSAKSATVSRVRSQPTQGLRPNANLYAFPPDAVRSHKSYVPLPDIPRPASAPPPSRWKPSHRRQPD
ncbi:MAG: hypothetical protein WDW38_005475 [Sanguina aurantia]